MKKIIENLIKGKEIIFFTGAGISYDYPTSLPLGNELIDIILTALNCKFVVESMKDKDKYLRPEVVMQVLYEKFGTKLLESLVYFEKAQPNRIHHVINILCAFNSNKIITTNLDLCHEKAITGKIEILHLHGKVDDYKSITYSLNQVGRAKNTKIVSQLPSILTSGKAVIFLGYSGLDEFDIVPVLQYCESNFLWVQHSLSDSVVISDEKLKSETPYQILKNKPKNKFGFFKMGTWDFLNVLSQSLNLSSKLKQIDVMYKPDNDMRKEAMNRCQRFFNDYFKISSIADSKLIESELFYRYLNRPQEAINILKDMDLDNLPSTTLSEYYRNLGYSHYRNGDYDSAYRYFELLMTQKNVPKTLSKALILKNMGNISYWKNDFSMAREKYKSAIEIASKEIEKGLILQDWALLEQDSQNNDEAIRLYKTSEKILNKAGDIYALSDLYNNRGILYEELEKFEDAKKEYFEALKLRKDIKHIQGICYSSLNLGILYRKIYIVFGKKKSLLMAKEFFENSLELAKGSKSDFALVLKNYADFCLDEKDLKKADSMLSDSVDIYLELNNMPSLFSSFVSYIELYILTKNNEKLNETIDKIKLIPSKFKQDEKQKWLSYLLNILSENKLHHNCNSSFDILQRYRLNQFNEMLTHNQRLDQTAG